MTLLNPSLPSSLGGPAPARRRAVSLRSLLAWQARRIWLALERVGQHRAAPELRRAAARLAERHPELAASLCRSADEWTGARVAPQR